MIKLEEQSNATAAPIAVIGMSGRFPNAPDIATFWKNLVEGRSGITDVPDPSSRNSALPQQSGYVPKCAVVKDADQFDAAFFGIYPKQAAELDPQQRLFLETAWLALEDAGYAPGHISERVGVFAGCHMNTYIFQRLAADQELRESLADTFPGGSLTAEISNDKDYLATRVAFHLNLNGPCVAVQTACSTSLVAIAQACECLAAGGAEMALAGGVTITFPQEQGYLHTPDSILSPDGVCRAFDANAAGTVFGDGVGAVLLKRLDDAVRDGDSIYAVIKGWGVNNDGGDKAGYTAPSIEGQSRAIALAHQRAGVTADTITCVEAHGTGTQVGDPIELEGLTRAFRRTTDKKQFCRIGSIKTSVGHLDVAAGVASLIKTCLSLKNQLLPASLNFETPNPRFDFENSPFIVNDQLSDWPATSGPRRAGISSFGVGGTNAHLVVEEAPVVHARNGGRPEHSQTAAERSVVIPLSAKSKTSLESMIDTWRDGIKTGAMGDIELDDAWDDVAYTMQVGRTAMRHRAALLVQDRPENEGEIGCDLVRFDAPLPAARLAFMFPGQGSQHLGMARQLWESYPLFATHLETALSAVQPHVDTDLRKLILGGGDSTGDQRCALDQTANAQPALYAISVALGQYWLDLGASPDFLLGHSVGEFAAAALSGVMSVEDAGRLVALRGKLMQQLPPGSMLVIRQPAELVMQHLPEELDMAAINAPELSVISGPEALIAEFAAQCEAGRFGEDWLCSRLRTSHAFHSRMMDAAVEEFRQVAAQVQFSPPQIPIVSSVSGSLMSESEAVSPDYWAMQIREPVRFSQAVTSLLEQKQVVLLEVGPAQALSTLARQHALTDTQRVVSSMPHPKQVAEANRCLAKSFAALWCSGIELDWERFTEHAGRRLHLPGYAFDRKSFWFSVSSSNEPSQNDATLPEDLSGTMVRQNPSPQAHAALRPMQVPEQEPQQNLEASQSPISVQAEWPSQSSISLEEQIVASQLQLMRMQLACLESEESGAQLSHARSPKPR